MTNDDQRPGRAASSWLPAAVLRGASILLLVQGAAAWSMLLGIAGPGEGLDGLAAPMRKLLLVHALLCPVAMVGTWSATDWGAVLWGLVPVSLLVALATDVSNAAFIGALLALHGGGVLVWFALTWRAARATRDERVMFR